MDPIRPGDTGFVWKRDANNVRVEGVRVRVVSVHEDRRSAMVELLEESSLGAVGGVDIVTAYDFAPEWWRDPQPPQAAHGAADCD